MERPVLQELLRYHLASKARHLQFLFDRARQRQSLGTALLR